jgi:hypothetical protein
VAGGDDTTRPRRQGVVDRHSFPADRDALWSSEEFETKCFHLLRILCQKIQKNSSTQSARLHLNRQVLKNAN